MSKTNKHSESMLVRGEDLDRLLLLAGEEIKNGAPIVLKIKESGFISYHLYNNININRISLVEARAVVLSRAMAFSTNVEILPYYELPIMKYVQLYICTPPIYFQNYILQPQRFDFHPDAPQKRKSDL